MSALYALDGDAVFPRDDANRYRLYARRGQLELIATAPTPGGLGEAIVAVDEDCRQAGMNDGLGALGAIGVLDGLTGHWIINPWHRPETPVPYREEPT